VLKYDNLMKKSQKKMEKMRKKNNRKMKNDEEIQT
jgi:hypothetical protein